MGPRHKNIWNFCKFKHKDKDRLTQKGDTSGGWLSFCWVGLFYCAAETQEDGRIVRQRVKVAMIIEIISRKSISAL